MVILSIDIGLFDSVNYVVLIVVRSADQGFRNSSQHNQNLRPRQHNREKIQESNCAPYSAIDTDSCLTGYSTCIIYACPGCEERIKYLPMSMTFCTLFVGDYIAIGDCDSTACVGYQYIRLMDNQQNELAVAYETCGTDLNCAYLEYSIVATECQTYSLLEGCVGDDECAGEMSLSVAGVYQLINIISAP